MAAFKLNCRLKKVLVVGDLHLHDNHKGRHRNYLKVCFWYLGRLLRYVREKKPDCIIFAGDLVGVKDKVFRYRSVLLEVCKFFEEINRLLNGNVYVVRGNHDFGQNLDYDFLYGMGYFKTSNEAKYIDMIDDNGAVQLRFHLVDYGKEKEPIELCHDEEASNVVIFHNNMKIQGQTTWYPECEGFELSSMTNWEGVDMAIGGHIHNPSPWSSETTINGKKIELIYLGCPTRPIKDKTPYEHTFEAVFEYTEGEGVYTDLVKVQLPDIEETFFTDTFVEDLSEEEIAENVRREDLHAVLKDLLEYRIADGDPIKMIHTIPNTNPNAVKIAEEYILKAYAERKVLKR